MAQGHSQACLLAPKYPGSLITVLRFPTLTLASFAFLEYSVLWAATGPLHMLLLLQHIPSYVSLLTPLYPPILSLSLNSSWKQTSLIALTQESLS